MASHKRKASRALEPLNPLKASPATAIKDKGSPSPESRALADLTSPTSFSFRFHQGKSDDLNRSHNSPTDKENRIASPSPPHTNHNNQENRIASLSQIHTNLTNKENHITSPSPIHTNHTNQENRIASPLPIHTNLTNKENRIASPSPLHKDAQQQTVTKCSPPDTQSPIEDAINELPATPIRRPSTPLPPSTPQIIVNLASPSTAPDAGTNTHVAAQSVENDNSHITIPEAFASPSETARWTPPPRPTEGNLRPMSRRRSRELLKARCKEIRGGSGEVEMLQQAGMEPGVGDEVDESRNKSKGGNTDEASDGEVEGRQAHVEEQQVKVGVEGAGAGNVD